MINLKSSIIRFNADPVVKSIRDYYSVKSFMEIISKSRNETAHSSFLAWLLEGKDFASSSLPLLRFLNLLVLNDSKEVIPVELERAVLSGKIVLGNTVACTEKCIKDISDIKSRDRVDIFINASLDGVEGFDELSIVVENKLFSQEGMPKAASSKLHDVNGTYAAKYNGLSQTQRYKYAYDDERAFDKHKRVARLFVYLTAPGAPAPLCDSFIHITYQDLLDNVLSPLACDASLSERSRDTLNDYCRCLSVPSSSDDNDDFTILAVGNAERSRLTEFWAEYKELILATSPVNQAQLSSVSDKKLAADFWDMNKVLFHAVYKAVESGLDMKEKACFESVNSKDYAKYSVTIGSETIRNLSKRKVVLLVVEKLIDKKKLAPDNELFEKMRKSQKLVYAHAEFEQAHANGELSDDAYNVRYSPVLGGAYHVNNQWGVGNFGDFVEAAESAGIIIKG